MSENNDLSEDRQWRERWRQGMGERWCNDIHALLTLRRMPGNMWPSLVIAFLLAGISSYAEVIDHRDFAIDTYHPRLNDVRLAEERARRYWSKKADRYGSDPVYLAIEASKLFESETTHDLYLKIRNSETTASFFARSGGRHGDAVDFKGIMIFDIRTGHFASAQGYVSIDTPQRGRVGRFGAYIARYIGRGTGWYSGYAAGGAHNMDIHSRTANAKQRAMALKRVRSYFLAVREGRRPAVSHRYVAVETLRPPKEWLKANLNQRAAARVAAQRSARIPKMERLHWLMVFDTQTEQFVGSAMYAVESLPAAGTLMTFDTMSAEFVGEGYQPLLIEDRLAFR